MSSFTKRPKLSPLDDGKNWEILEDFEYYLESDPKNIQYFKAGEKTDGLTGFWLIHLFFPQWGVYTKAVLVHDDLYKNKKVPRNIADKEFLHGMKILNVGKTSRYIIYFGVRIGGWWPYYGWTNRIRKLFPQKRI